MMDLPPLLYCKYKGGDFFCIASDLDRHSVHLFSKKPSQSLKAQTIGLPVW